MKNSVTQFVSTAAGVAVLLLGTLETARAATMTTTIDFESGFSDLQPVDTVLAGGNQVTFGVGPGTTGGISPAFIAEVGNPVSGFNPNDGGGTAIEPEIGHFFLTDEIQGPSNIFNHFIEFDQPVSSLSTDILDFGRLGSTVTLTAFSDLFSTAIASDTFIVVPSGVPNTSLRTLFVEVPDNLIQSASIVHSAMDRGTGIDNITFEMETVDVPEPSSMLGLLALGTLGVGSLLKCKRQQNPDRND